MGLLDLDIKFNLKIINLKAILIEKTFFLEWFRASYTRSQIKDFDSLLFDIYDDSLKIRALLRNIKSQINTLCLCFCQRLSVTLYQRFSILYLYYSILYFYQRLSILIKALRKRLA